MHIPFKINQHSPVYKLNLIKKMLTTIHIFYHEVPNMVLNMLALKRRLMIISTSCPLCIWVRGLIILSLTWKGLHIKNKICGTKVKNLQEITGIWGTHEPFWINIYWIRPNSISMKKWLQSHFIGAMKFFYSIHVVWAR